eukprot:sb/3468405/
MSRFKTIVVTTVSECDHYLSQYFADSQFVGLDCEWPTYTGRGSGKITLIQIASLDVALLFQVKRMGVITEKLMRFLEDKKIYKAGVEIHLDGEKLKKDWGVDMKGKVEIRKTLRHSPIFMEWMVKELREFEAQLETKIRFKPGFAAAQERRGWKPKLGLQGLASSFLEIHLEKDLELRSGNWDAADLTEKQKEYAAMDAWIGLKISLHLCQGNEKELERWCEGCRDEPYRDGEEQKLLLNKAHELYKELPVHEYLPGTTWF